MAGKGSDYWLGAKATTDGQYVWEHSQQEAE